MEQAAELAQHIVLLARRRPVVAIGVALLVLVTVALGIRVYTRPASHPLSAASAPVPTVAAGGAS
jgi:hypothetical protein